jgi:hypothetical protein
LRLCSAYTNRILGKNFRLCRNQIGWLVKIQFVAVGDVLDPVLHLGVNVLAIGSLFTPPTSSV